MPFKKGDVLRQKVQVIEGPMKRVRYDEDTGAFQYLIAFEDGAGELTERWFDESAVEIVT